MIVLRFYPNGEFSHGVDTSKRRKDKPCIDESYKPPLNKDRRDEYLQWSLDNAEMLKNIDSIGVGSYLQSPSGYKYLLVDKGPGHCSLEWEDRAGIHHVTHISSDLVTVLRTWRLTPLVHQSVESCENPENRKKLLSMSKPMARNIRNAVFLMEQQPGGKDALSFLTLTLPGLSEQGLQSCVKNWDYMVKRFLDWLSKRLKSCNIEVQYVYCTEIQTKRIQSRGEYAPHLHIVFRGRDGKKKPWAISPKQARKTWSACISSVVDEPFVRTALENLQRIRKSAARYLSKYMSKGNCAVPAGAKGDAIGILKTQWGGMSRNLSAGIRKSTERLEGFKQQSGSINFLLRSLPTMVTKGLVRYYRKGFVTLGIDCTTGNEYGLHVGSGCLQTPTYQGGLIPIVEYCFTHGFDVVSRD